jgi:hypothetical protein
MSGGGARRERREARLAETGSIVVFAAAESVLAGC